MFVPSSVNGYLSCFLFLAIVNELWFFITISSISFGMRYLIMVSLVPFSISYLYDFLSPLTVAQVKYKADLKKLHKPVTDMKESLIMNHVLNTSHLASSVSSIVCSKNSLFHPFTAKSLLWGHMHLLLHYQKHVCSLSAFFQMTILIYQCSTDCNTSQIIKMLLFGEYFNFLFSQLTTPFPPPQNIDLTLRIVSFNFSLLKAYFE